MLQNPVWNDTHPRRILVLTPGACIAALRLQSEEVEPATCFLELRAQKLLIA